jgi:hypothetical protein
MTYGVVIDIAAPVEVYDEVHAELQRRITGPLDGFLFHVARPTAGGFQVIEVWETKEQCDRYNEEYVTPAIQQLLGDQAQLPQPVAEEFEPRGLIIPSAQLAV